MQGGVDAPWGPDDSVPDALQRHLRLFETLPTGVVYQDRSGRIIAANPAAADMLGVDLDVMLSREATGGEWAAVRPDGAPLPADERPAWIALTTGEVVSNMVVGLPHGRTGAIRWFNVMAVPVLFDDRGVPQRVYAIFTDITEQRAAQDARRVAEAREHRAQLAAATAQGQLSFLLSAGALLTVTRDRDELLRRAVQLVVTGLGDWALVFTPDPTGDLRTDIVAHHDPDRSIDLTKFLGFVFPATSPLPVPTAYRTGTTQLVKDLPAVMGPKPPGLPPELREMGFVTHSIVAAPLVTPNGTVGVLSVMRGAGREAFTEEEAALVTELARQLSLGLHSAEVSVLEHGVAEALQRAVLPTDLPDLAELELGALYLAATEGVSVGGDFYDAFMVTEQQLALVVGDVIGHDVDAASVMGQLRNTVRTVAVLHPFADWILTDTQRAMGRLMPEALATVFVAIVDIETGEMTYANAGHPPPALRRTGGTEFLDGAHGTLLGADSGSAFVMATTHLQPGDLLVMFTDGLIEHRQRDYDFGVDLLYRTLQDQGTSDPATVCREVVEALLDPTVRSDDVCVLAARYRGRQ